MRAVILAGGTGTRLQPYTTVLPKPLMPVGGKPILEILIQSLARTGIDRATIAVGHLASLIEAYFGDGSRWGIAVDYSLEEAPLGTAGPIGLIEDLDDTFLVMNGDLLTDLPFDELIAAHRSSGATATIGVYEREIKIDLGVIESGADGVVAGYTEKPTLTFVVSMGVYLFEPHVKRHIDRGDRLDLPDLILRLIGSKELVVSHRHRGYWLDIGRPDDYQQAQLDGSGLSEPHSG